jgi:hypothetical protein
VPKAGIVWAWPAPSLSLKIDFFMDIRRVIVSACELKIILHNILPRRKSAADGRSSSATKSILPNATSLIRPESYQCQFLVVHQRQTRKNLLASDEYDSTFLIGDA